MVSLSLSLSFVLFCFLFCFFSSLTRSRYLSLSLRFLLILLCGLPEQESLLFGRFSFFINYHNAWSSDWDHETRFYLKISENLECLLFQDRFLVVLYHLFVWSNLNFLHNSNRISFSSQSCLVLHSFYANLLYLLIIWLIVSSLLPHNLHLLHLIYFYFDVVCSYSVVLCCY